MVRAVLVGWLVFAIPHLGFHFFNLDPRSWTSRVVQLIALGITVLVPIGCLMSVQKLDQRLGSLVLR